MSAEGESSPNHAVVPTDAPGTASTVDMDTNKHVLNSLNNIDQTMVKMAGLIAKFAGQAAGEGSKRSADPQSDTDESESEHEHHPRRSNSKRARENTPSDDD